MPLARASIRCQSFDDRSEHIGSMLTVPHRIASGVLFGIGGGIQEMVYAALQEIVPIKHRVLAIGRLGILVDYAGNVLMLSRLFRVLRRMHCPHEPSDRLLITGSH